MTTFEKRLIVIGAAAFVLMIVSGMHACNRFSAIARCHSACEIDGSPGAVYLDGECWCKPVGGGPMLKRATP